MSEQVMDEFSNEMHSMVYMVVYFVFLFGNIFSVGPVFEPSITLIEMIEKESKTFEMRAVANPTSITYTLYKGGQQSSSFTPNNGKLVISNVRREEAGNYSLKATNSIGSAYHHFQVKVKCKAEGSVLV